MVNSQPSPDATPPSGPTGGPPTPHQPVHLSPMEKRWRYLTADLRSRPDFVILGAQRGYTTSLFRWLSSHPSVAPPSKKEIPYVDVH